MLGMCRLVLKCLKLGNRCWDDASNGKHLQYPQAHGGNKTNLFILGYVQASDNVIGQVGKEKVDDSRVSGKDHGTCQQGFRVQT